LNWKANLKNKLKGLFKKGRADDEFEDLDVQDEQDSSEDSESFSNLPENLKRQLHIDDESEEEDDDDEEEFVPQQMTLNKEVVDEDLPSVEELLAPHATSAANDKTNPSRSVEKTREITPKSLDPERIKAIRENSYMEDDFDEHSGINQFKEFQIPKQGPLSSKKFLRLWGAVARVFKRKKNTPVAKTSQGMKTTAWSWDQFVTQFFAPANRPVIHRRFVLILILLGTYSLGKLVAVVVSNQGPTVVTNPSYNSDQDQYYFNPATELAIISNSDLFNSKRATINQRPDAPLKPVVDETLICVTADRNSSLPIKLVNTIVLQDSVKSIAAVQVRGSKDYVNFREGQKIENMAEIGKIDRLKLVVKNLSTGQCENVRADEEKGRRRTAPITVVSEARGREIMKNQQNAGIVNEGNNFKINKGLRDQMLSNISEVLTQARAVQMSNPDGSLGFKMTEIVPGSIYSQLNIQDGDIVEGINGAPITNLKEVMDMFGKIREIDNLSLTIKRNGVSQNFDYSFD